MSLSRDDIAIGPATGEPGAALKIWPHGVLSSRILAYTSGSLGKSTVIGALELTSLFYLTDLIGVAPGIAGTALFAVQLGNAAMDAAVGHWLDRSDLRRYRAGRFILAGSALAFLAFSILYALPILEARSAIVAILLIFVARLAISLMEVPHNSLLIGLTRDSRFRTKISAFRFGFSTLGILILSFAASLVMDRSGSGPVERNILIFGLFCSILGPAVICWSWWCVRGIDHAMDIIDRKNQPNSQNSFTVYLRHMRSMWHRDYILILAVLVITPFCTQLFFKSVLYEATYVLRNRQAVQLLLPAMMVGQIIGVPIWSRMPERIEKAHAASLSFLIVALGFIAFYALARNAIWLGVAAAAVIGVGACGATALLGSMSADCCDLARLRGGRTFDATALGTLSCAGKVSSGLCALGLGWGLSFAGYYPASTKSSAVIDSIHVVSSLVPTAAALICALALLGYRLSYASHDAILASPDWNDPDHHEDIDDGTYGKRSA